MNWWKLALTMALNILVTWGIAMLLVWLIPVRGTALSAIVIPISALVLVVGLFGGLEWSVKLLLKGLRILGRI